MRNKFLAAVAVVAVLAAGAYFFMRSPAAKVMEPVVAEPKEPIVFGYVAAMSKNPVATWGIAGRLGFEVAVNEINAAGGILGRQIRTVIMDDEGDKEISKKQVEQLVFQEKANAIVGPANSGNALHWLDVVQDNEVLTFVPIATVTEITTRYAQRPRNYIFRMTSIDKEQVRVLIAWSVKKTNNGKIAIFHDTTPYGLQGEKDTTEVLARWGKTPSMVKSFEKTSTEEQFTAMLKEAEKGGAEAIMVYSLIDGSSAIAKAAAKIKGFKPILLGTAANAIDLNTIAGDAASLIYWSAIVIDGDDPRAIALEAKATALNGSKPTPALTTTENAHDIVYMLKAAFEKAGSTDKKAVRDALEELESMKGLIKTYTKPFSKDDHEALSASDFTLGRWIDGVRTYLPEEVRGIEVR